MCTVRQEGGSSCPTLLRQTPSAQSGRSAGRLRTSFTYRYAPCDPSIFDVLDILPKAKLDGGHPQPEIVGLGLRRVWDRHVEDLVLGGRRGLAASL